MEVQRKPIAGILTRSVSVRKLRVVTRPNHRALAGAGFIFGIDVSPA